MKLADMGLRPAGGWFSLSTGSSSLVTRFIFLPGLELNASPACGGTP